MGHGYGERLFVHAFRERLMEHAFGEKTSGTPLERGSSGTPLGERLLGHANTVALGKRLFGLFKQ